MDELNLRKPDVQTVAVTQAGGGLTILRIVENEYIPDPEKKGERKLNRHFDIKPEYVEELLKKYVDGGSWKGDTLPVSWRFVPNDFVNENTDREFRGAWKDGGTDKPQHDMPKARELLRNRLRKLRGPLLDNLDTEYMRADESGDSNKKQEIANRKQQLRDITKHPDIEKAKTVDDLKKISIE